MVPSTAQLTTRAWDRLHLSYHPATNRSYDRMFVDLMTFLVSTGLCLDQVTMSQLFVFREINHSAANIKKIEKREINHSAANIKKNLKNYLAAIRAKFILYGLLTLIFRDERIQLYIRSLEINRQIQPRQQLVIIDKNYRNCDNIHSIPTF